LNNIIKRPSVGWESNDPTTRASLETTILPLWYDEVQESNRFIYRFNSGIKSWISELVRDQTFIAGQFTLDTADITKPYYIARIDSPTDIPNLFRKKITSIEEDVYSDVFRHAVRIQDLGEEYKANYKKIKDNISNYKYITTEDVDAADVRTDAKQRVLDLLLENEKLISGELVATTTMGRIIDTDNAQVVGGLERVLRDQTRDAGYFCIPLLAEPLTYRFYDIDENELSLDPSIYVIGFSGSEESYNPDYDIDQDGYVSVEDISFIRGSVGRSLDNTTEKEWKEFYFKLDKNQDGIISESDVVHAELSLHGVLNSCVLIRKPIGGYCKITYEEFDQPYVTYARPNFYVRGGTFDYTLRNPEVDPRIGDGFVENSSGYITGFNKLSGEIWTGRIVDDIYQLQKVSFANQSKMAVVAMTSVDEVLFFVVESTIEEFKYYGSRYAILRVDIRKEKVEISNDLLSFGINIPDDEKVVGIQSTSRKDIFRIFTDKPDIITIKLVRNSVLVQQGSTYTSQGLEQLASAEVLSYQRIFNDIDSFGFNFGMERLLFESNEDFSKRIDRKVANPPNNSISGMHYNYGLDLGLFKPTFGPYLYRDIYLGLSNVINPNKPIALTFNDVDINRFPIRVINLHIENPILKIRSINKQMFLDGRMQTVVSNVRSEKYYEINSGDFVEDKTLILKKDTIRKMAVSFIKGSVETITLTPDMDEDLVSFIDIDITIDYSTIDPDGIEHEASDDFKISIPSIDLIDTSESREPGEVCQIHPDSKTARYIPRTYSMVKGITKEYIGDLWNKRVDFIRKNDTSYWGKTVFDVTPYNDRFNSTYIVDKTYFNTGMFTQEQEEVIY
jgi:DNA-binding ferritin-like protein (Dps family)/nitrogen regulatory protein PII-like uncharacterized protein